MKETVRILVAAGIVSIAFAACSSKAPESAPQAAPGAGAPAPLTPGQSATGEMPPGHPPIGAAGGEAPAGDPAGKIFSGVVTETMNAANYTYVQVDNGQEKIWAAAPEFKVKKGDKVNIPEGMPMQNYESATLKRKFDVVYFVAEIGVGDKMPGGGAAMGMGGAPAGMPAGMPAMPEGQVLPEGAHPKHDAATAAKEANVSFGSIKKADKTVAEIFAGQAALSGKEVSVRGKVIKYNPMIMGKNWIHLQDGTGAAGANDLTITTAADSKVGDTVLVTGMLTLNKDFGMGYKYGVIIEDAKVKIE